MINKKILSKTKNRLTILNTLVVGILFMIFSIFIYIYFYNLTYKKVDSDLNRTYKIVLERINFTNDNDKSLYKTHKNIKNPRHQIIYIWENDKLIKTNDSALDIYRSYDYVRSIKDNISSYKYNDYNIRELKKEIEQYTIEIIKVVDIEIILLNQLILVLFVGLFIVLIISYIVGRFLTQKSLKPIEATWENQILFMQDASHEFRTPLTIISTKLQSIINNSNHTIEDEIDNINVISKEVRRLKKMTSDLLKLCSEDAIITINKEKFNIYELIQEIVVSYEDIINYQNKTMKIINNLDNNYIYSDKEKIKQLVIIFIDNAIKYTNTNDYITIELNNHKEFININIIDTGIGISEDEIPFIFNRFYRGVKFRKKNTQGSGVGLAIAKTIISNLDGEIKVNSEIDKGSNFSIFLPNK